MKIYLLVAYFVIYFFQISNSQKTISSKVRNDNNSSTINSHPDYTRKLILEEKSDTTANVSFGDYDGDGHLDILLVKGRHWPIIDVILFGDGKGGIKKRSNLSEVADRSYTGGLADFNGDGYIDIAVSNDHPDRKLVYLNDGKGNFNIGSEFGKTEWPTRNMTIADINQDGWEDVILANRGRPGKTSNFICLNNGKGEFKDCMPFAPYPASTISVTDLNKDGFTDLVVPYRDGGQSFIYMGNSKKAYSETNRIPFGPNDANIRAAAAADFNGDDLIDIITIDEFKGVYLYSGQRDQTFSTGISISDSKEVPYALALADLNNDKKLDIIIGYKEAHSVIFFNNTKDLKFESISFGDSTGTVYGFDVGDLNEDGIPDIGVAKSEGQNVVYFGELHLK